MTALLKCPWQVEGQSAAPGKPNAPVFDVAGYYVEGNSVLPDDQLDAIFTKYTGPAVGLDTVKAALAELQLTYRDFGFVTVGVSLPSQKITNGIIRVQVTEGRLAGIRVVGNRHFSSNNVMRSLPGLATNDLLNSKWFLPELNRANANPDRQISAKILPGPDPGTSALDLDVDDRLPLHGHLELNNRSTPDTPPTRIDAAAQYNNLWQLDQQAGVGYSFSPQAAKPDPSEEPLYDRPAIANYSTYYRLPLGTPESLRETYENMPVNFGYDEATHRFNLPPLTGSPELIVYASRATTDTGARYGPVSTITDTATLQVTSVTAERDPTETANLGLRIIEPLPEWHGVQSSWSAGFDYKTFQVQTLTTNLTVTHLFDSNGNPTDTNTVAEPENGGSTVHYAPLAFGWSGSRADPSGLNSFGLSGSLFFKQLSSSDASIQDLAGSSKAGGDFATINFNYSRNQKLPAGWSLLARVNGQWGSEPLISNEQFALGGENSVRGYFEGDAYGDAGWSGSLELRTPFVKTRVATIHSFAPTWLHAAVFVDYGQRFLLDPPAGVSPVRSFLGTGFGLTADINNYVEARVSVAWPAFGSANTQAGQPSARFALGIQF